MKLFKTLRKFSAVRRFVAFLITQYVKLVWLTNRWEFLGKEHANPYWQQNKPLIGCFWHGRLLMMFKGWFGPHKLHTLNSSHADGEILARAMKNFGFGSISGSSTRGGRQAFLTIVKTLRQGDSIGITPDGPRGPRYQVSPGVIRMARLGNAAILPVSYSATRGIFIKSWDRFFLPLPFGRGVFIYGPMIDVATSSKNDEELRQDLESILKDLTIKADLHCGRETL